MTDRTNKAVSAAVVAGLQAAAASPSIALAPQAVSAARDAVLRELQPTLQNLTNAEPLWRSRVIWGALLSAIGATAALIGVPIAAEMQSRILDVIMLWVTLIGLVSGPALTLWGRLRARKPIGRSPASAERDGTAR